MDEQQQTIQPTVKNYSTASLVLGILSIFTAIFWFIGVVLGILAIVFGAQSTKSSGRTKAIAGIVLGAIGIVLSFSMILLIFLAVPALQKNSRDTARKNDAALIASRVAEYQSNNSGNLPDPYSLSVPGMTQITSISGSGEPTKETAVFIGGENCDKATSAQDYSITIMLEKGTISCIGS